MRFAHVTTFYPPFNFGGDGIVVQRFARALAARGHEVTVVHDVDTFALLGGKIDEEVPAVDDGVRVIPVAGRPRSLSTLLTHQLGRPTVTADRLRGILDDGGFDVVHFHNVSMVGGPGILSYGRDAIRLYTAHEHWLVCPMHVLWKYGREPCNARACLRCAATYRRPPQLYRYTGYMERQFRHVDLFFAQTEFSREKHHQMGFTPPMEILSPFLPASDASGPSAFQSSPERPYVLYAGRLERMKGLDDIIPVFRSGAPAELWIAGSGPHGGTLEALAQGSTSVRFLGHVPNERIQRLMADAVAVIVPTVGYETFGFTALEAFRAGAPVIARRSGPLPELIEASGGGMLFDEAEEVEPAVRALMESDGLRARMGSSGHRAFEERWSEQVVVPWYLDRIDRLRADRMASRQ